MMVRYKGIYCHVRQYVPSIPIKWGLRIWALVDAESQFVYNFDIYCDNKEMQDVKAPSKGEAQVELRVVKQMVKGLENLGHVVVTDNYSTSIYFFTELLTMDIYATCTIRSNKIELLMTLIAKKELEKPCMGL